MTLEKKALLVEKAVGCSQRALHPHSHSHFEWDLYARMQRDGVFAGGRIEILSPGDLRLWLMRVASLGINVAH